MHRLVGISEPSSRSIPGNLRGNKEWVDMQGASQVVTIYTAFSTEKNVTTNVFQREWQCAEGCNLCSVLGCVAGPDQRRKHDALLPYQSGPGLDALSLGDQPRLRQKETACA